VATIRYYGDMVRVGRYRVFGLVRTYQARAHYAAHGAVKEIAGAAHQLLWAQEGWMPPRLAIFWGVFQEIHLVTRDLMVQQHSLYWRQHIPVGDVK
jgi:hypothetical protein